MVLNFTLEEWLKYYLVPPSLYLKYKFYKESFSGEKEIHLLNFLVDPKKDSIDIGANKGVYSYKLSDLSRKVFAFEPNPKIFSFLKKSCSKNVQPFEYALSNQNGTQILRIPKGKKGLSNQGGSLSTTKVDKDYVEVPIQSRTLDSFNFENIGFIKIDVEGFEQEVLEGSLETISKNKPVLLIEMEEVHTKRPILQDIKQVEKLGYKAFALFRGQYLRPIDFFDPEVHHKKDIPKYRSDYLFNFFFFPLP